MLSSSVLVLAGAALSAAQAASTTASPTGPVVSLFLPDTDSQKLVASVVGSAGSMTTYVVTCPQGTDASDCGYSEPVTITENASSLRYSQVCLFILLFSPDLTTCKCSDLPFHSQVRTLQHRSTVR